MSVVERMANTLFLTAILRYSDEPRATSWGSLRHDEREEYRDAARQLIGELRDPTRTMVEAGTLHMRQAQWNDIGATFTAMIDAALSE
jgi:hypothetical protein